MNYKHFITFQDCEIQPNHLHTGVWMPAGNKGIFDSKFGSFGENLAKEDCNCFLLLDLCKSAIFS